MKINFEVLLETQKDGTVFTIRHEGNFRSRRGIFEKQHEGNSQLQGNFSREGKRN